MNIDSTIECPHQGIVYHRSLFRVESFCGQCRPGTEVVSGDIDAYMAHFRFPGKSCRECISYLCILETHIGGIHYIVFVLYMACRTGICQTRMGNLFAIGITLFILAIVANIQIVFGTFFLEYAPSRIVFGVLPYSLEHDREIESFVRGSYMESVAYARH